MNFHPRNQYIYIHNIIIVINIDKPFEYQGNVPNINQSISIDNSQLLRNNNKNWSKNNNSKRIMEQFVE